MERNIIIDKDNKVAIYYCPKCKEFTSYDEWAQATSNLYKLRNWNKMILESLWFYVFLFIAGAIWLYLTE